MSRSITVHCASLVALLDRGELVFLEPTNVWPNINTVYGSDTEETLETRAKKNKGPGCASFVVPVMYPWAC